MTVSDLLIASRASHDTYRQLAAKPPKPVGWQALIWDAYTLRQRAHEADPHHADPAWHGDKAPHDALMAFYEQQLGLC